MMLAERLGARMRYRISRRRKTHARGKELNFRRTFRRSIQTGGLPYKLERKQKKQPPLHLIVFVDVSGSMDAYSLFFARFAHAMTGGFRHMDTYLFHTRLIPISSALREADPLKMMTKLSLIAQGWSGGTKIGLSLAKFNQSYGKGLKKSRTTAIIMSDGYDTGDPQQLAAELQRLKRHCHKVIWLNPLLGRETYEPITQAMAAARPHIDLFAPAHNLQSLLDLEDAIVHA
jgi:uncharacterized protein with von Willebrand factor type A (vWA) domain